nr:lysophospholipid acyltransferase family protein [Thioalkalivibrio sp. XN8]
MRAVSTETTPREPAFARVPVTPLGLLRALVRLPLLFIVTIGIALAWGLVALWPWSQSRRAAIRQWVTRRWATILCRLLGARIETDGGLPPGPAFLITNHVSYLDIPVLMSQTGCRFVSKHEVADWPLIGLLAKCAGTLFVKRGHGPEAANVTLEGMQRAFEDGDLVVFFPEGTTGPGDAILPFRSGLLTLPARDGHPVYPAVLVYDTRDPRIDPGEALAWWGKLSLPPHLWRLVLLPGFTVRLKAGQAVEANHRKHLARALQDRVEVMHAELKSRSVSYLGTGSPR